MTSPFPDYYHHNPPSLHEENDSDWMSMGTSFLATDPLLGAYGQQTLLDPTTTTTTTALYQQDSTLGLGLGQPLMPLHETMAAAVTISPESLMNPQHDGLDSGMTTGSATLPHRTGRRHSLVATASMSAPSTPPIKQLRRYRNRRKSSVSSILTGPFSRISMTGAGMGTAATLTDPALDALLQSTMQPQRRRSSVATMSSQASTDTLMQAPLGIVEALGLAQQQTLEAATIAAAAAGVSPSVPPMALSVNDEGGVTMQLPILCRRPSVCAIGSAEERQLKAAEQQALEEEILAVNFEDVTVVAIKTLLRRSSLSANGKKDELMDRLRGEAQRIRERRSSNETTTSSTSVDTTTTVSSNPALTISTIPPAANAAPLEGHSDHSWDALLICSPMDSDKAHASLFSHDQHANAPATPLFELPPMSSEAAAAAYHGTAGF